MSTLARGTLQAADCRLVSAMSLIVWVGLACLSVAPVSADTLWEAAARGDLPAVTQHLRAGADVNAPDEEPGWAALHHAVRGGHVAVARALLDAGADPQRATARNSLPLAFAAERGQIEMIDLLLSHGAGVNAFLPPASPAIGYAAAHGHIDAMDHMRRQGADVNRPNQVGATPLFLAASTGNLETIKWLIDHGADVRHRANHGFPATLPAAVAGRTEAVRFLLDAGLPADEAPLGERSLIGAAMQRGHMDVARLLIERGASVTRRLQHEHSLVHYALMHGDVDLARDLLDRGAPMSDARSLVDAASRGHVDSVQFLLENGIRLVEYPGRNPLQPVFEAGQVQTTIQLFQARRQWYGAAADPRHDREDELILAAHAGQADTVAALLRATPDADPYVLGAALKLAELEGRITVARLLKPAYERAGERLERFVQLQRRLERAAGQGDMRQVHALLESDACPIDSQALNQAAAGGHLEIMSLLIDRGALPNARRGPGNRTPISHAVETGQVEAVRLLLEHEVSLDQHAGRYPPMYSAASRGRSEILRLLLDAGADINIQAADSQSTDPDALGDTPLIIAAANGRIDTVRLLIQRGADPTVRGERGMTAAQRAAREGHHEIAALLDPHGDAPVPAVSITRAMARGAGPDDLRRLLDAGANPNELDELHFDPAILMTLGETERHLRMLKVMVEGGASVDVPGILATAVSRGGNPAMIEYLIGQGVPIDDARGWSRGYTALLMAVERNNMPVVRLLLEHGADPTLRLDDGRGIMDLAHRGSQEEIRRLIEQARQRQPRQQQEGQP